MKDVGMCVQHAAVSAYLFTFPCRRAKAIAAALDPTAAKPPKHPPPPSSTRISYIPAQQYSIPTEGVAVLKLVLQPAALQPAAAAATATAADVGAAAAAVNGQDSQQQQQQRRRDGVVIFGSGKSSSPLWLMQAYVTPWSDDDSLSVWASRGAVLQQQQQPAAAAGSSAEAVGTSSSGSSSGFSLTVDGQEVQSMEAFVQQLIALSQQAQQQQQ